MNLVRCAKGVGREKGIEHDLSSRKRLLSNEVIIVAAGQGKRMKQKMPKQYLLLHGKPLLYYTIRQFLKTELCNEIVVVVRESDFSYCQRNIIEKYNIPSIRLVKGGKERQDSVYRGLSAIAACDYVIIHDAVRCLVSEDIIRQTLTAAQKYGAALAAAPVKDTIKITTGEGFVQKTIPRTDVWSAQTPQIFSYDLIQLAYKRAYQEKFYGTDDAMLVERLGRKVKIVPAHEENIKVTTPLDFQLAETILSQRSGE